MAAGAGEGDMRATRVGGSPLVAGLALAMTLVTAGGGFLGPADGAGAAAPPQPAADPAPAPGPSAAYDCAFNESTDAYTGADGTASAIGWEGNAQGVVTCLGGSFVIQYGILYQNFGFGLYGGQRTTWTDADGYLPAQITTFRRAGARVSITEFADRLVVGGHAYVAVYARVVATNPTDRAVTEDPDPSPGLIPLVTAPDSVAPHTSAVHDYVVAADRFGHSYPWPGDRALAGAGGFDQHFAHMENFWNRQLDGIAGVRVPDGSLDDAYRSGFITTQIARSGDNLNTGVNGYESEFSHDVIGILTNLFTQGYFADAHPLLLEARNAVGSQGQYVDGIWTFPVPWAVYLMKTGDVSFVKANFSSEGPSGPAQPSIEDAAHQLVADRTGPSGIMEATDDIDTQGYWTVDDYEALLGLAAYRYLALGIGDAAEAAWASRQYQQLLTATDTVLGTTIQQFGLDYLPCSILQPNTANRCADPEDANWTSPFGNWAWEGELLGAPRTGPGLSLIDATYTYGFGRLQGLLPPGTSGGFPDHYYYSSAYNAAQGSAGLAGSRYRDQGILSYQFMIGHSQAGPYSWWESSTAPLASSRWIGSHPAAGQGASPHAWGMAGANKVLLDSLVAQRSDGALIVGRGVPAGWLDARTPIEVSRFPTTGGRRMGLTISAHGRSVSLHLAGGVASGPVLFELPSFVDNIESTSAGRIEQGTGTVTLSPRARTVTVVLRRPPTPAGPRG